MIDNKAIKYKFMNIYLSKDKYNELYNNMNKGIDANNLKVKAIKFYETIGEVSNYIDNANLVYHYYSIWMILNLNHFVTILYHI